MPKPPEQSKTSSHIDDDFCTDILNGLVPREKVERTLEHVAQCVKCESMFREHVSAFETLRAGDLPVRSRDGRWVHTSHTKPSSSSGERTHPLPQRRDAFAWLTGRRLLAGGLVAAVAVAMLVLIPLRPQLPPPEYRLTSSREILETRSGAQPIDKRFWRGLEAYEENEFERAIWLLRQAGLEGPYNELRMIYIASAATLMEDYPMAVDVFQLLDVELLPEPWRSETKWIKYIALAGDRRGSEAKVLLEELVGLDNDIGELARERTRLLD